MPQQTETLLLPDVFKSRLRKQNTTTTTILFLYYILIDLAKTIYLFVHPILPITRHK